MSGSQLLGSIGQWDFYIATMFGEYADEEAVKAIQRARYELICFGKTGRGAEIDIFCTGITLYHEDRREISFHDYLMTTYHIYALGNKKAKPEDREELGCACSFALESQDTHRGYITGLPHENRVANNYPEGFDLDRFRKTYAYGGRSSKPDERIELFRHFKPVKYVGDKTASFGVYQAGYREFVEKRLRRGEVPATKWLFCSKPGYYQYLYRPLSAMLVSLLLADYGYEQASPSLYSRRMTRLKSDVNEFASGGIIYDKTRISYRYPVIISRDPEKPKTTRWYDFISEIVDVDRAHDMIRHDRFFLKHRQVSQIALRLILREKFEEYHNGPLDRLLNAAVRSLARNNLLKQRKWR